MSNIILILQDKNIEIKLYKRFFYIKTQHEDRIISYRYIKAMYIHKDIKVDFKILLKLSSYFEIHKIDTNGNIVIK